MLLSKNRFYVNQINPIKQAKLFLIFGLCASFCISVLHRYPRTLTSRHGTNRSHPMVQSTLVIMSMRAKAAT